MSDGERLAVPETAGRMGRAASALLAALTAGQRATVTACPSVRSTTASAGSRTS
jgi:hypothetical protein